MDPFQSPGVYLDLFLKMAELDVFGKTAHTWRFGTKHKLPLRAARSAARSAAPRAVARGVRLRVAELPRLGQVLKRSRDSFTFCVSKDCFFIKRPKIGPPELSTIKISIAAQAGADERGLAAGFRAKFCDKFVERSRDPSKKGPKFVFWPEWGQNQVSGALARS